MQWPWLLVVHKQIYRPARTRWYGASKSANEIQHLSLEERFFRAENLAVFIAVTAWKPPFAYANHMHLCKFLGE